MKILITGGAGFVGSSLARAYRSKYPKSRIVTFDNLHRAGSELNVPLFKTQGIEFAQGDVRRPADLEALSGTFDLIIEASAEPSVLAGTRESPHYLIETNFNGALNCLEFTRARGGHFVFLSTSRVYSVETLRELPLRESATRFETHGPGIAESFETGRFRSLYGTSKLAAEMLVQEYAAAHGITATINRCGVIAGPGQFGKIDQGVFTLWVARHFFGKSLTYTGFGGKGKQVRDLLHPMDLFELLELQHARARLGEAPILNVGGGLENSISLAELTELCREITGQTIPIGSSPDAHPWDIPYYVGDSSRARDAFGWKPKRNVRTIIEEIHAWLASNRVPLEELFNT